jgi:hypothetical protein
MRVRTWVGRVLVPAGLIGGMLAGATGVAIAVPEPQWRHGHFVRAGVPVYAEPVDGWTCHLGGPCRDTDEREPDDPPPIWHSTSSRQSLDVECYLGRYYKIHEAAGERREGWALDSNINTDDRVKPCHAGDF